MPCKNLRKEIAAKLNEWKLVDDCLAGQRVIKEATTTYLPMPNASDTSKENIRRYDAYLTRAMFYNATARTKRGLVGMMFATDPVFTSPTSELDFLKVDANGGGTDIDQLAKKALGDVLAYGRVGTLVDYPRTLRPLTKEEQERGDVRPAIHLYHPKDVINWRVKTFGSKKLLTLVVIREVVINALEFDDVEEVQYRVLRLSDDRVYTAQVYKLNKEKKEESFDGGDIVTPTRSDGSTWDTIPFAFIGAENNEPSVDDSPLFDLACVNIAHYRNSADYEEMVYMVGQPTPVMAGVTKAWYDDVIKGKVFLGSRSGITLPVGGSASLLEVKGNNLPSEALDKKEKQMIALGAQLVQQDSVQKTATESNYNQSAITSTLVNCAKNVSSAFSQAMRWCADFVGMKYDPNSLDELYYEIAGDAEPVKMAAQELQSLVAAWQSGAISFSEMRDNLRKGGVAHLDDEDAKNEIEAEAPVDNGNEYPEGNEE